MTSHANSVARRRTVALRSLPAAAALFGIIAGVTAIDAAERSAALSISVRVPSVARMSVLSQSSALVVSQQDLERGYVDVLEPMQLAVYSNAAAGYSLEVLPVMPLVQSIEVYGLRGQAQLGAAGGLIAQRWSGPRTESLRLRFRLGLAPGTRPGIYPWPLHIAVQPLEAGL